MLNKKKVVIIISKLIDLTDAVFGYWKVLYKLPTTKERPKTYWRCLCLKCNKVYDVSSTNLRYGKTSMCNSCARRKQNDYDLSGDYGIGYTQKGEEFYFDKEDYEKIKQYCWIKHNNYIVAANLYPSEKFSCKQIKFHQLIMNEKFIDHINHITYDNRKENLRLCTSSENSMNCSKSKNNTSGVIGVHYVKADNVWQVSLQKEGTRMYFGRFKNFEDAVKTRLLAEKEYFGEFAPQKHLFKEYGVEMERIDK